MFVGTLEVCFPLQSTVVLSNRVVELDTVPYTGGEFNRLWKKKPTKKCKECASKGGSKE